jgi:hypothetical protein
MWNSKVRLCSIVRTSISAILLLGSCTALAQAQLETEYRVSVGTSGAPAWQPPDQVSLMDGELVATRVWVLEDTNGRCLD